MLIKIKLILIVCTLFLLNTSFAQTNFKGYGNLIWADEFDGTGIPNPEKWDRPEYNRRANSNGPDGWWSKQDSYLDGNGNLVIRVRKIPNKNSDADAYDYSCGAIRTKNKFEKLHGIFEIKCQLPTQQGWWVAFWMMQGNVGSVTNGGVDGSEVDIVEAFGWTDNINQAVHWDGYGDAHKSIGKKTLVEGIRNGYHTFTLEWHPEEYIFFIDGVETWRTQGGGVCNIPGYIKVTGEISTESWAINQYWSYNPANAQYPDSFLVDYVRVYEFDEGNNEIPIREMVENCYPEGNLIVGSACHEHYLGTPTEDILDTEFAYVTPANDFKQSYIHPEPGKWEWAKSDTWVNHCRENNQVIRMHAPISPQCSKWAKEDSRTGAELELNMTEYMTELCNRYNDTTHIKWLDVVNETVSTDGTWFGPKTGTDKWENPWPKIGYDNSHSLQPPIYIKKAFEIANTNAPDIKQIINQHGGMEPAVWDKIKSLVSYLRDNNLRVDGIGWQAHLWMGWEKEAGNLERLSELIDWCHSNNLEFHITEFNVWLKPEDLGKLTEQANTFYEITKLAAEKQKTGFVSINYWHIRGVETQNKDRDGGPWAENYEPKEAYLKIKDAICEASEVCSGDCSSPKLILNVDTFKTGGTLNMLGGQWLSSSDLNSTHSFNLSETNGFENSVSAKFNWERKKGAVDFPFAIVKTYLNESKTPINLSDYFALKFQCKGTGVINVGLITEQSNVEENHYFKEVNIKNDWTDLEILFADFTQYWGSKTPIDTGSVIAIVFSANSGFNVPGEMWIDNIQFISENAITPAEPVESPKPFISLRPKVNQLGYLPNAFKQFSIVADSVSAGQKFVILNEAKNEVYSGNLENVPINDINISGEMVFKGEFSNFSAPGKYQIQVGNKTSFPFKIHEQIYDSVLTNSLRFFYLARANDAIEDPVTGLSHTEAHNGDKTLDDGLGNILDLSGGWYNAGDFGKWVHTTAFACTHLLNLYETNPNYFKLQNLSIPESDNDLPDILDEVKVGLNWLLKMQRNNGAIYHKIDTEPNFAYGYGPDEDPHSRKLADLNNMSTIDAADFAAVIAHASRVFALLDTAFSEVCKTAALKSWDWVQANSGIGQLDIYYTDPQSWQEEMWAKAEIYMLTGNQSLLGSVYNEIVTQNVSLPTWTKPQLFSYASLYNFPGVPASVKNWIKLKVENYANEIKSIVDESGYGSAIDELGWGWGTNTSMSNFGATFIYAHIISGDEKWLKYASQQLDYLMGRNSLDFSFVTGYGTNSCKQPFHWITKTYNLVPPGLIGQGATGAGLKNLPNVDNIVKELMNYEFPSAKIYVDSVDSWNSNEVGIYTVSSLAFLTGYLALHNRNIEITNVPVYQKLKDYELEITDRNNSLFCENCVGKTQVRLYSLSGHLLFNSEIESQNNLLLLVEYDNFVQRTPIIIYKIIDETGKFGQGKLCF